MNSFIDFEEMVNVSIERGLMQKDEKFKILFPFLRKYGLRGTKALTFITELAAIMEEMKAKGLIK